MAEKQTDKTEEADEPVAEATVAEAPAAEAPRVEMFPTATPKPTVRPVPSGSETAAPGRTSSIPGIYVDTSKVVVLASRLGQGQRQMPKVDPKDRDEKPQYFTPDAWERGEIIDITDIPPMAPGQTNDANIERLLRQGAIGRLDHPDAAEAIQGLTYRRDLEGRSAIERGSGVVLI